MDEQARFRSRGIRTIGRLTAPASDDVLLAQWALPAGESLQRQDVAVSSDWVPRGSRIPARIHQQKIDPISLFDEYDRHQRQAVRRLLDVIEAEIAGLDLQPVVFEPPSMLQSELLQSIRRCAQEGDITAQLASSLEKRAIAAGEWVVRCWAAIELYRSGMITVPDLEEKRAILLQELNSSAPLIS